jgi:hypothetical protein
MAQTSYAQRAYTTFSGVDIEAHFHNVKIGTLQAISYSITREIAPVYTLGYTDIRSISKGKRGIAGAMIFINFDAHGMLSMLGGSEDFGHWEHRNLPKWVEFNTYQNDSYTSTSVAPPAITTPIFTTSSNVLSDTPSATVGADYEYRAPQYVDQLPPFDVTLSACNDSGSRAKMYILGVQPMNEGSGWSIDDLLSEQQVTYIAHNVVPWLRIRAMETQASSQAGGTSQ